MTVCLPRFHLRWLNCSEDASAMSAILARNPQETRRELVSPTLNCRSIRMESRTGLPITAAEVLKIMNAAKDVEGWLSPWAACLLALLDRAQKENGICGDLFEIGAHHGKSAIVLGAMIRTNEKLAVCDIFEDQRMNVSRSGAGDYETFMRNIRAFFPDNGFLKVLRKSSLDLKPAEIGDGYRLFHIDGGHTITEVLSDLALAAQCLAPCGAIVLDDIFRSDWPEVTVGALEFLKERSDLSPLVIAFNKLVIVPSRARPLYTRYLESEETYKSYLPRGPFSRKKVRLLGHEMYVFNLRADASHMSLRSRLYALYFGHAWLKNPLTTLAYRVASRLSG